jgi:diguanylate cyclase (GGDEF)-like protein
LLLGIVLFNHIKNSSDGMFRQRYFRTLIICDLGILLTDMLIFLVIGLPGAFAHVLLYILQSIFFVLCSFFCLLWALYCAIRPGNKPRRAELALLAVPFLLLIIFLGFNFAYGFLFRITPDNGYERGVFFHIVTACTYLYVVYSVAQIWRSKKQLSSREFYTFLLIPLFPMAVGIVQLFLSIEVLMVWPATALAMVVMQMVTLTEKINLDHLTGLYNRKYLDDYIADVLQMSRSGGPGKSTKKFAAIMLDIDNFKSINDTFGHVEGDHAIVIAADLLRKSIRKGDFVSRYGGDEFLIVLEQCSDSTPARVIRRIRENVQKFNNENDLPYVIEFSVGYKVYANLHGMTSRQIFSGIDELMYQNKQSKLSANA